MGIYLNRFWQPDGGGMNKVERTGGPYHPYHPDKLADYELLLNPSCATAVANAQEALARVWTVKSLRILVSMAQKYPRRTIVGRWRLGYFCE